MAANVLGKVYETLLCSPGMSETVKIDVKVSRKAILLLNSVIENGLGGEDKKAHELLDVVPPDDLAELKLFSAECLKKAGLTELSDKMKNLQTAK